MAIYWMIYAMRRLLVQRLSDFVWRLVFIRPPGPGKCRTRGVSTREWWVLRFQTCTATSVEELQLRRYTGLKSSSSI